MLRRVIPVRTDVSEESNSSIIRVFHRSMRRLLFTPNVPSSPMLVTLTIEAIRSPQRWFLQEPLDVTLQNTASIRDYYHP
jgi:hypothetical protein